MKSEEMLAILAAQLAFRQHAKNNKTPPEDVGNGWIKVSLPPHPMFANAVNFQKELKDGFLNIMVERRKNRDDSNIFPYGRWHLSMSHNSFIRATGRNTGPGRVPTWDELKEARYKFIPDGVNMAIMFPPGELYYNLHATCLHLLEIPVSLALNPKENGGI